MDENKIYAWVPRHLVEAARDVFKFLSSTAGLIWLVAVIAAGSAWGWLDLGKSILYLALTVLWFFFLFLAKRPFAKICFGLYTLIYIFLIGWIIK